MKQKMEISCVCASPGFVAGNARVLNDESEIAKVQKGEIVILPCSHPMYAIALMNASALVCEVGGRISHICVVAMEMGIPCVTQAHEVTKLIKNGQFIQVNANEGKIYVYE